MSLFFLTCLLFSTLRGDTFWENKALLCLMCRLYRELLELMSNETWNCKRGVSTNWTVCKPWKWCHQCEWKRHLGWKSSGFEAPGRWCEICPPFQLKVWLLKNCWSFSQFFLWQQHGRNYLRSRCYPALLPLNMVPDRSSDRLGGIVLFPRFGSLNFNLTATGCHCSSLEMEPGWQRHTWHSNSKMTKWFIHILQV